MTNKMYAKDMDMVVKMAGELIQVNARTMPTLQRRRLNKSFNDFESEVNKIILDRTKSSEKKT